MIINKLKYMLALLSVSVTAIIAMSQETPTIKIVDFRVDEDKDVATVHTLAQDFAYVSPNSGKCWALLIIESNEDERSIQFSTGTSSQYAEKFKCDASHWYEKGKWSKPSQEEKDNLRARMEKAKMSNEKWISISPGVFTRFKISTKGNDVMALKYNEPEIRNSKGEIIGHIEEGYFIANSSIARQFESGKVYRLRIEVPQYNPRHISEPKRKEAGYAVFKTDPEGASVYMSIDGKTEYIGDCNPDATSKRLTYGTYQFRIEKGMYHTYEGSVKIDSAKVFQNIKLRPNFGKIKISTTPPGAQVRIDNHAKTYITPCETDNITSGNYVVKLILDGHDLIQRNVIVSDGETTELNESFNPQYAQVTVRTISGATITINGETKGTTSFSGRLNYNIYDIEVSKAGYENAFRQIEINTSTPQEITLYPTPIYGMVDISTQPSGANITIDGKNFGTSPNYIDTLLVGNHIVKITLDGYNEITRNITIKKGEEIKLAEKLNKTIVPNNDPIIAPISPENPVVTNSNKTLTPKWAPEVTEEQKRILTELINSMVLVEGGSFYMGAQATDPEGQNYDPDAGKYASPVHQVTLSDYYIGKYEVTQEQWQVVMGSNPSRHKGSRKPVERVCWYDCQDFLRKLQAFTGLKFALPTEAQWEYAARGGSKSKGYIYSGSNNLSSVAWYDVNGGAKKVGRKSSNELGLYDMSGNVSEWCQDWYGSHSSSSQTDPTGSSTGSFRVNRGGSWDDNARCCRVSFCVGSTPGSYGNIGLRLAINIGENSDVKHDEVISTPTTLSPNWSSSATAEQRRIIGELIESMVLVEGGTFTMGATSEQGGDAYDWEKPTHRVTLSDYYIGKYEVTQEQWQAVMGSNPSSYKGSRKPVESVSWNDCQEFVRKLQALTGLKFELPTEAQWEYAARGGNKSRGYKYAGSNTIDDVVWCMDNASSKTHPVGQKLANELGLYDMSGNVNEWCLDWYGSYSSSTQINPTGSSIGSYRVTRGDSWKCIREWKSRNVRLRISTRNSLKPIFDSEYSKYDLDNDIGFRLVVSQF